ncbi:kinesin-like protein KIN-14M isoform X3 [Phragmites australis]|uniref:kinesin-like protein KIN-14M isoform X3 n=1 Tax=Phragmites australis TaxID=29695 RepID=UPI002D788EDD|nr:kinesin-like protein KIN-14M isoform X3 [Phragmites australis]
MSAGAADRGAQSPERRERRRRSEAVTWLRALLAGSGLPLPPPRASDDELRAALADGALLCAALRGLGSTPDEGGASAAAAGGDVGRFVAAVERMGLPSFAASDLDRGPMSAVIVCLLALRDRFGSHVGEGLHCSLEEKDRMHSMEFPIKENGHGTQNSEFGEERKQMKVNLQKVPKSPATSEPSSPISRSELSSITRHSGHNFHEVFHLRQGVYSDMPTSKILEMMKSTSLDNAPTQSLLSFVNGILDEIVEKKNEEIPYHIACLLRKVIVEIERRISTQAEHIRNQNNLMRAREEKYKSRIRVLEALASGTNGQTQVNSSATNGKAHVAADHVLQLKMEKGKIEERQLVVKDMSSLMKDKEDVTRLIKDKEDMARLLKDKEDIIRLMKEKEEMVMLMKEKEDKVSLKTGKVDDRNQSAEEHVAISVTYNDEIIRMMKEKEGSNHTIMKLKLELEAVKSSYEESQSLLESTKEDVLKLLKDKENSDNIISKLRQELAVARRAHKTHIQELESRALQANEAFEHRIKEVELLLKGSRKRGRDLEELLKSRIETWELKEIMVNQFVGLQIQNIQDLRLSSVSIRHEIQNCQKRWSEELSGLGQNLNVLINDAENYHAALEENRRLFNEIQELKGNIRVYCRIRPFLPGEDQKSTTIEYVGDNGELIIGNPTRQGKEGSKSFKFNKVLGPTASQDEVFKDIQPLIRSVLDGYNVCIFAYGQTGSGKTYTMTGPENATEKEQGVNYRALNDLFHISHNRGDTIMYEISVQMIEIYNEQIRDLLCSNGSEKKLGILNTSQPNGLAVPDATLHPVKSTTDVIELMRTGLANRAVGSTALNERSSRSHSVVTIHIRGVDLKTGATLRGALHLVDLAGSERVDRSAATGDRLKEAQHINKSLSALGDVIFSLSQKNAHVPYRNSKLTQVLQSSLGDHAKTLMFVQMNPDVSSYLETISTLKFAERVSGVELGAAKANKEGNDIREFMEQLSLLKHKIAKKDEEINRLKLLKTQTPRARTIKRADSPLKHSSSSPGIASLGSKIQHRRTASGGKVTSIGSRAGSDADNFSDISDRHSESGSMQSVDDIRPQRGIMGPPMLSVGEMGQNSANPELASFGYANSEERLSDISDSGLSMGTETDGSISSVVELTLFPEQEKTSSTLKEQEKAPRTPNDRLSKVATRVQKTTPKTAQTSSLWPKLRDPPAPRSPMSAGRVATTQAISAPRTSSTTKRWT